ncbi:MAG: DUF2807 domain-containing protein [Oscillospiraceae bacterium]|nr:DUF2807 domain-containing protein [Oscillospiraceae bacterium]
MRKLLALVLILGLALGLAGCTTMRFAGQASVRGNRDVTVQTTYIDLGVDGDYAQSFRLEISGFSVQNATPRLMIDEQRAEELGTAVVVAIDDNLQEHINVSYMGNGVIRIRSDDRMRLFPSQLQITTGLPIDDLRIGGAWDVTVHCNRVENFRAQLSGSARGNFRLGEIDRLDLSGSGSARMNVQATANVASVTISGSGRVNLNGAAETADFRISGSGRVEAFDFPVDSAVANISGSGRVDITVAEELDARISGSGRVTYDGNPRISQHTSGSGRITSR